MLRFIGLDIGTTTISAVVIDGKTGEVLKAVTEANDTAIIGENESRRMQDPEKILKKVVSIRDMLVEEFSPIDAIGVTGQMHGMLYLDSEFRPLSPLYTWQDGAGQLPYKGSTYAKYLSELSGYPLASGYGLVTHFVNRDTDNVPHGAEIICTVHDFIVSALTGQRPIMHSSDAASFGCFDLKNCQFDKAALEKLGIDLKLLPEVTSKAIIIGKDKNNIPVCCAIGDNQASVVGSVKGEEWALVNIGTGSQVSVPAHLGSQIEGGELRPLFDDSFMLVGAPLCGGRSFALLHKFFKECALLFGASGDNVYKIMDSICELCPEQHTLEVDTRFCGTRKNPELRGSISNISEENFTPSELTRGFSWGMAQELYSLYEPMLGVSGKSITTLVGSGNAIRKSTVLKGYMQEIFGLAPLCPKHREEAAFGAALCSSVAAGFYDNIQSAQNTLVHFE